MPFCLRGVPGAVLAAAPGAEGPAHPTEQRDPGQIVLLCRLLPHHELPGRCQCLGLWQYPKRCTSSWSTTSLLPPVSVCLALFARGTAEHCSAIWVPLEGQQPPSTASQPDPARLGALGHHPLSPVVLTKFFCHLEVCPSQPYRTALTSRMLWKMKLKT